MTFIKKIIGKFSLISNKYIDLIYNKDTNELDINCNLPITLNINADFTIQTQNGEFSLITNNKNICLDSVNAKIYLNSRKSKKFELDPEAEIYKKQLEEHLKKLKEQQLKMNEQFKLELKKEIIKELTWQKA